MTQEAILDTDMETLMDICLGLLPVAYSAVLVAYVALFFRPTPDLAHWARGGLIAVIGLHGGLLLCVGLTDRITAVSMGVMLTVLALAMAATYVYVEVRIGVHSTGPFILAFVSVFQLIASLRLLNSVDAPSDIVLGPIVAVHVLAAAFGYAAFIIAALSGLMYILLFHHIRKSRFGIVFDRLPALEELDDMNLKASASGLFFITISILVGGYWMGHILDGVSVLDPKIIVAFLIWLLFASNIALKKILHRNGLLTSYLSLAGFVILMFSMLAVNAYFSTFHVFN